MVDLRYNTLLIIEGERCEKDFFTKFTQLIGADKNIKMIPFCNDIYELYKQIKKLGQDVTSTKEILLSNPNISEENKNILRSTKFVYIYLVFDLDLQNDFKDKHCNNLTKISNMLKLFNDESGFFGKLIVNYPMMESYRHFYFSNTESLKNKRVKSTNDVLTKYKQTVGNEGTNTNVNKYTLSIFDKIAKAHCMQANLLLNDNFKKPSSKEYEALINMEKIHNKQSQHILKYESMFVLNTFYILYGDFYPKAINARN